MISKERAFKIRKYSKEWGVIQTADDNGMSEESVRRAVRRADQLEREAAAPNASHDKGWDAEWNEIEIPATYTKSELIAEMLKDLPHMKLTDEKRQATAEWCLPKGTTLEEFDRQQSKPTVVGIVGDLHEPFCLDAYLNFCVSTFKKHGVSRVVFIGDIIDNHYTSYHEADPDGMGGGDELDFAISRLAPWYEAFPDADCIIGNHDRLIRRKAFSGGIPKRWVREFGDVLGVPNWKFSERVVIDGVQYIHGEGGTARTKSRKDLMSTVQGHLHTQCYTEWTVGANYKIFGCQVGCGIDHETYAMTYAKNYGKPAIGCAIVTGGKQCVNELMSLGGAIKEKVVEVAPVKKEIVMGKVVKKFGVHFHSDGGALTLSADEVTDGPSTGAHKKTHSDGWTITGVVSEDYYTWVNDFEASHPVHGKVWGNFEEEVHADSEEGFGHFNTYHAPEAWDYGDI